VIAMPATEVVRLGPADLALLHAALDLLDTVFGDDERPGPRADDATLQARLDDPRMLAMAACRDGRVVGALTAHVLHRWAQPGSDLYLYDLAVDEACRRQGVATALLNAAWAWAAERGIDAAFVQAHAEDGPAVALYARHAQGVDVLQFDIEIPLRTA
jgi:aminoglycoside 3-N-acetyltransferase I